MLAGRPPLQPAGPHEPHLNATYSHQETTQAPHLDTPTTVCLPPVPKTDTPLNLPVDSLPTTTTNTHIPPPSTPTRHPHDAHHMTPALPPTTSSPRNSAHPDPTHQVALTTWHTYTLTQTSPVYDYTFTPPTHTLPDCSPLDPAVGPTTPTTNPMNHLLPISTTDTLSTPPTLASYPHLVPPRHLHTTTSTPPDDTTLTAPTTYHQIARSPSRCVTPVPNTPSPQYAITSTNTLHLRHTPAPATCDDIAKLTHTTPTAPHHAHAAPTSVDHPPLDPASDCTHHCSSLPSLTSPTTSTRDSPNCPHPLLLLQLPNLPLPLSISLTKLRQNPDLLANPSPTKNNLSLST